jgi:integrase
VTVRRSRGVGGLHFDQSRQRWIASATVGYTPAGKRIVRRGSGKTKTEAKAKLREILRDHEEGVRVTGSAHYTVAQAVTDWLIYGLSGRDPKTIETRRILAEQHVIPALGSRKLRELTAEDVDRWLEAKARTLSTQTLQDIRSILRRAVARGQARDKVRRNVVLLCELPTGQEGRPSKALPLTEATALLDTAEADASTLGAYIVVALLTGARTEELRALMWSHVDLVGQLDAAPPIPPHVQVWRSVRSGGDTKTRKSRRTLALPGRCVAALTAHRLRQAATRAQAGDRWADMDLVYASETGTALDAANVRRGFRRIATAAGLDAARWTPRELRHSFVSLLSDDGVPLEQISRLVGHSGTTVTELIYLKQIRPVIDDAVTAMDRIFRHSTA